MVRWLRWHCPPDTGFEIEPWRSEAEHANSRSRRLPAILTFTRGWGRNIFVSFQPLRPGTEPRTLVLKAAVLTTTLGPRPFSAVGLYNLGCDTPYFQSIIRIKNSRGLLTEKYLVSHHKCSSSHDWNCFYTYKCIWYLKKLLRLLTVV